MNDTHFTSSFVAVNPANGLHLRAATAAEVAAYRAGQGNAHPAFTHPVRVGAVLIDEDFGPVSAASAARQADF